ncbi:hypothetical protein F4804DRAFT_350046 [Jackrogersella minutella]|nr:hypothetical protein F4804DRAFT_350046 [Jackrogersella minutella]
MANVNLQTKSLPSGAVAELVQVAKWLQSIAADFQPVDNVEICQNTEGLADITKNLLRRLSSELTARSTPSENRVTSIHFSQPAALDITLEKLDVSRRSRTLHPRSIPIVRGHIWHPGVD